MEEKLQFLCQEIQDKFGENSNKMFSILLMLIFMDTKEWTVPDYIKSVPEFADYIDYLENSQLLKEIFQQKDNNL